MQANIFVFSIFLAQDQQMSFSVYIDVAVLLNVLYKFFVE